MKIKRREFVKLATAGIAMPWLSTMARAQLYDGTSPKRVFIVIDPHGRYGQRTSSPETDDAPWIVSEDRDYSLTPQDLGWMLKPLENYVDSLAVMSGSIMRSRQVLGGGASHAQIESYALTGSRVSGNIRSTDTVSANPGINSFIGDEINAAAAIKSVYNSLGVGDPRRTHYNSNGLRATNLSGPATIYRTAFGTGDQAAGVDTLGLVAQQTVVEQVRNQINQIAPELAQANASTVMDAYRSSIDKIASELEIRANSSCESGAPNNVLESGESIAGVNQTFDAIYDLFACGLTPSILYGYEGGNPAELRDNSLTSDDVGNALTNGNFHRISHRTDEATGAAQGLIMRFQISEMARLADRLSVTPELDGSGDTMMDNTIMFYTQAMSSNAHKSDTPYYRFFLAGKNTNIQRGMHFDCSGSSCNEIFTTLAQGFGIPITQFGGFSGNNYSGESFNRGPISKALVQTLGV